MAKVNALTHLFNSGEVSRAALNRVDKEAIRLYAERQENILPYTIGKGLMRPGTQLLGTTASGNRPRYLPFVKAVDDTALLELTSGKLRVWIDDVLLTRPAVTAVVGDGDFSSAASWTLATSGGATANINSTVTGALYLAAPFRGGEATCTQSVTIHEDNVEHALRIAVSRGPVTLRVGSTDGGDDYIKETSIGTGEHSLAFVPTGASGGNDSFTKLLLHCNGVDASTAFTDSSASAHTVTANGNAQIDTAQSKFGGASGLLDGVSDYLTLDGSSDFAFGTGDFTIDSWIMLSAGGITQSIYDGRPTGTPGGAYAIFRINSSNFLEYTTLGIVSGTPLSLGVWYHIAVSRTAGTTSLFLNGVLQASIADTISYINGTSRPVIGEDGNAPVGTFEFAGWLDEFRVSKGIGRWTANFTPPTVAYTTGSVFFLKFSSKRDAGVIVDSVQIESAGTVELSAPWTTDQLREIRVDESLDVIFMAHPSWQQRKIERRGIEGNARSWSLVLYQSDDGPFTVARTANVRLKPAATHGNTTLTADGNFFRPSHVGALFQLNHNKFAASFGLGAENTFTDAYRLSGIGAENDHSVVVTGTFVGTLTLQHSFEGPDDGWIDTTDTIAAPGTITSTLAATFDNQIIWTRVGFNAGAYTSGTATVAPTYGGWHGIGVCRVTSFTSPTVVNVEVLSDFKNTFYTDDWLEGEWSDERGWPGAVGFYDGRLWWDRKDQFWGSESNAYYKFNLTTIGDAGSVQRSIAVGGAANTAHWILGLQRLIFGTDLQEISARSSSFDAPITPSALTLKAASKNGSADFSPINFGDKGIFIQRSGKYLYELTLDGNSQDYVSKDMTRLNEDIGDSGNPDLYEDGFCELAMQISPMPYVWALRNDGIAVNTLYNPGEEARGLFRVVTGGLAPLDSARPTDRIISIVTLPTFDEDAVYLGVERTISNGAGGTTQAFYLEKMAQHREAISRIYNSTTKKVEARNGLKLLDSFITATGTGVVGQVITGLTHLAGRTDVMIIGQIVGGMYGPSTDFYTVSASGTITTLQAFSGTICVGLGYAGIYQSAKLAYGAQKGTALTQSKRVEQLGMVVLDTHPDAIRITPDFDLDPADWDELPRLNTNLVEEDPTAAIPRTIEEDMFPFPGQWDTDSRVCLYLRPGYSACLSALVIGVNTAE